MNSDNRLDDESNILHRPHWVADWDKADWDLCETLLNTARKWQTKRVVELLEHVANNGPDDDLLDAIRAEIPDRRSQQPGNPALGYWGGPGFPPTNLASLQIKMSSCGYDPTIALSGDFNARVAFEQIRLMNAATRKQSTRSGEPDESGRSTKTLERQEPKQLLFGWPAIADALKRTDDKSEREQLKNLNKNRNGPIVTPKQGGQPVVDRELLLEWWNNLYEEFHEIANRQRDRDATVEATHAYGKDGVVVPGINGSVKKRRKTSE